MKLPTPWSKDILGETPWSQTTMCYGVTTTYQIKARIPHCNDLPAALPKLILEGIHFGFGRIRWGSPTLRWNLQSRQMTNWLVVSTHLKNISQNGNLPQVGVRIKNVWNHHLVKKLPKTVQHFEGHRPYWSTIWAYLGLRCRRKMQFKPLTFILNTVDGSEIPRPTTWDV